MVKMAMAEVFVTGVPEAIVALMSVSLFLQRHASLSAPYA